MAPNPGEDTRVDVHQLRKLRLSDFQSPEILNPTAQFHHTKSTLVSDSSRTADRLRSSRDRFAAGVPLGGNRLCYNVDRAATLAIYREVLSKVKASNHRQIQSEANVKIQTVLGIRKAEADDIVFAVGGMLLSPLEPQYAEPRIEYADDPYGHKAVWRLKAWRKAGWPNVYPSVAVENEKKVVGKGNRGSAVFLQRIGVWDDMNWGEQVDANPGSWQDGNKKS